MAFGKGNVNVNAGKGKLQGTLVDVVKGRVNVEVGKGKPKGSTTINVGSGKGGGAFVNIGGHKGKPVYVVVNRSPFDYIYAAIETQLHDDPNMALFFLEKHSHPNIEMKLHFTKSSNDASFLPHEESKKIPFLSNKVNEILNPFSIKLESAASNIMKNTIKECEKKGIKGKERYCVHKVELKLINLLTKTSSREVATSC